MIAWVAPMLGALATIFLISEAFPGFDGNKSTLFALVTQNLAESIVPSALGITVAIVADNFHRYLVGRVEALEIEMRRVAQEMDRWISAL